MQFEDWMKAGGSPDSAIAKYVGVIDGPLSARAKMHALAAFPLRAIFSPQQFLRLSGKLASTPEFELENARGHHMYGAALGKYAEFLVGSTNSSKVT